MVRSGETVSSVKKEHFSMQLPPVKSGGHTMPASLACRSFLISVHGLEAAGKLMSICSLNLLRNESHSIADAGKWT